MAASMASWGVRWSRPFPELHTPSDTIVISDSVAATRSAMLTATHNTNDATATMAGTTYTTLGR